MIINPISNSPFYVGETKNYERRVREHTEGTDQISGQIIRQIKANGFVPLFVVLESHDNEETAMRAEIFWIETLLSRGVELVNSQAFTGWQERRAKRNVETRKADQMAQLRKVANGKKSTRTRSKPASEATDAWSQRETRRLAGMQAKGMTVPAMAALLKKSQRDIAAKLGDVSM